jgi:uncharacterized protein (DUF2132 family)
MPAATNFYAASSVSSIHLLIEEDWSGLVNRAGFEDQLERTHVRCYEAVASSVSSIYYLTEGDWSGPHVRCYEAVASSVSSIHYLTEGDWNLDGDRAATRTQERN